jgi:outer membrane biosynthesis protein TonB
MEFVMLESRGGNYLVVAQNIAWLRTAENGQTSVGMVGGQPLLVVGSIQEVADKILSSAAAAKAAQAEPVANEQVVAAEPEAPPPPSPAPAPVEVPAPEPEPAPLPEPEPMPEPEPEPEPMPEPEPEPLPEPEPEPVRDAVVEAAPPPPPKPSERARPAPGKPMSLSDRLALASAPKVKAGSQRFMGMSE